jgi:lipopolysaccharide transport system ATP-binding protein
MGKMDEVTQGGRTVLFVSHNMGSISRLCERCLWLENGRAVADGESKDVIAQYLTTSASKEGEHVWPEGGFSGRGVDDFKLRSIRILNQRGEVTAAVSIAEPFIVEVQYEVRKRLTSCRVGFEMESTAGVSVFATFDTDNPAHTGEFKPGNYVARCVVPAPLLNEGFYFINLYADVPQRRRLARAESILSCQVVDTDVTASRVHRRRRGLVHANFNWTREKI